MIDPVKLNRAAHDPQYRIVYEGEQRQAALEKGLAETHRLSDQRNAQQARKYKSSGVTLPLAERLLSVLAIVAVGTMVYLIAAGASMIFGIPKFHIFAGIFGGLFVVGIILLHWRKILLAGGIFLTLAALGALLKIGSTASQPACSLFDAGRRPSIEPARQGGNDCSPSR